MMEALKSGTIKQVLSKTLSVVTQTMSLIYHSIDKENYWLPPAKILK